MDTRKCRKMLSDRSCYDQYKVKSIKKDTQNGATKNIIKAKKGIQESHQKQNF